MKILVVGAMASEISFLKTKLDNLKEEVKANFTFYLGTINNNDIILVESGIGRCMSGALIGVAKSNYDFDMVINVGIAGGTPKVNLGDIVVCNACVYGDVDLQVAGPNYKYGQMASCPRYYKTKVDLSKALVGLDYKLGDICTCDSFTTSIDVVNKLQNEYFNDLNLLAFDMETTAFAQICNYYNIPFLAIRAISDVIGKELQTEMYRENELTMSDRVNEFMYKVLKNL